MRLSTVFELLLIFLLIAFAAYGRVIDRDEFTNHRAIRAVNKSKQSNVGVNVMSLKQATENVNKYCTCVTHICNCCRDFNIPIVGLKGPGCASLQYLDRNRLGVQLSIGDNILTSTIVNGDKPKAVCFPMPGALTHFCGRVYSIQREADDHFKACLGLELQSSSELEASLRVSCFRFGPDGVALRPAEPLPIVEEEEKPADDDDDDDPFGFDDDDDDDDDEEDDSALGNSVPGSSDSGDSTYDDDDDEDDDILGLGPLIDLFTGDDESDKKKKPQVTTQAPLLPFTIPIITKPTTTLTVPSDLGNSNIGNTKPIAEKPEVTEESAPIDVSTDNLPSAAENAAPDVPAEEAPTTELPSDAFTNKEEATAVTDASVIAESVQPAAVPADKEPLQIVASNSDIVENIVKPAKKVTIVKKVTAIGKKPSLSSNSPNAIKNDSKKPAVSSVIITKPTKPGTVQNYFASSQNTINNNVKDHEEDDDEDDDDILGTSDLDDEEDEDDDEEEEDDEKTETETTDNVDDDNDENEDTNETEDDKNEEQHEEEAVEELIDDDDDDDDDDEAEEAVLTALVDDSDKIQNKVAGTVASATNEEDESDYDLGISDLLVRRRRMRSGRQSKVMRL